MTYRNDSGVLNYYPNMPVSYVVDLVKKLEKILVKCELLNQLRLSLNSSEEV